MQDLRNPIGLFFLILGLILCFTPATGAPLTDIPINLYTGGTAVVFGVFMLLLARRARS